MQTFTHEVLHNTKQTCQNKRDSLTAHIMHSVDGMGSLWLSMTAKKEKILVYFKCYRYGEYHMVAMNQKVRCNINKCSFFRERGLWEQQWTYKDEWASTHEDRRQRAVHVLNQTHVACKTTVINTIIHITYTFDGIMLTFRFWAYSSNVRAGDHDSESWILNANTRKSYATLMFHLGQGARAVT